MRKNILLLCILLPVMGSVGFAQTGSVSALVTDSVTGQPVVNLTVFIPNTTLGTATWGTASHSSSTISNASTTATGNSTTTFRAILVIPVTHFSRT